MANIKNKADKLRDRRRDDLRAKADAKRAKMLQQKNEGSRIGDIKAVKRGKMSPLEYAKRHQKGPAKY